VKGHQTNFFTASGDEGEREAKGPYFVPSPAVTFPVERKGVYWEMRVVAFLSESEIIKVRYECFGTKT
jgi:hypothetical protein